MTMAILLYPYLEESLGQICDRICMSFVVDLCSDMGLFERPFCNTSMDHICDEIKVDPNFYNNF